MQAKTFLDVLPPAFDPSGAECKAIVSNVSPPALKGTYTGFTIRDDLLPRAIKCAQ